MSLKIEFKVQSCVMIPEPRNTNNRTFIAIAHVRDLPHNFPTGTNPREQKLTTKVAKAIKESLTGFNDTFHLLNRGMLVVAGDLKYDRERNILTLWFTNDDEHGVVDGGHTYEIIKRYAKDTLIDQYVRVEIMTGVQNFEDLARARNTSTQVKDKSLAELEGKFDLIKEAVKGLPFEDRVAYKENASGDVDVLRVIAILSMFNLDRYGDKNHPVSAYSSTKKAQDDYLKAYGTDGNPFKRMIPIAGDIFRLYDYVEAKMPELHTGQYGKFNVIGYKDGKYFHTRLFSGEKMKYKTPTAFIMPIVAAFRCLVKPNQITGEYQWAVDPIKMFDRIGADLVATVMDHHRRTGGGADALGKDASLWNQLYMTVRTAYLEMMLERQSKGV